MLGWDFECVTGSQAVVRRYERRRLVSWWHRKRALPSVVMGSLQGNAHLTLRPTPTNYYSYYYSITAQLWALASSIFLPHIFRSDTIFFHPAVSSSFPASLITTSIHLSFSLPVDRLQHTFPPVLDPPTLQMCTALSTILSSISLHKPKISLARHFRYSTFPFEVFKGHFQLPAPTQPYRLVLKLDNWHTYLPESRSRTCRSVTPAGYTRRPLLLSVWCGVRRWPLHTEQPGHHDSGNIWPAAEKRRPAVLETGAAKNEGLPRRCERQRSLRTPSHSHGNLFQRLPTGAELWALLEDTATPDDLESTWDISASLRDQRSRLLRPA